MADTTPPGIADAGQGGPPPLDLSDQQESPQQCRKLVQWVLDELVVNKGNFAAVLRRLNACISAEHQVRDVILISAATPLHNSADQALTQLTSCLLPKPRRQT